MARTPSRLSRAIAQVLEGDGAAVMGVGGRAKGRGGRYWGDLAS